MTGKKTTETYLNRLDGLRALAIAIVVWRHAVHVFQEVEVSPYPDVLNILAHPVFNFLWNGFIGVDLFFVISGFLITRHLVKITGHAAKLFSLKVYALKRILRIVPAYLFVLFACVAGIIPYYAVSAVEGTSLWWRVGYHLLFLQDYLPSNLNVVFWSLGVEEKFYLLAPFFLMLLFRLGKIFGGKGIVFCGAGLIIASMVGRYLGYAASGFSDDPEQFFVHVRTPFHTCFDPILMGIGIALMEKGVLPSFDRLRPYAERIFWTGAVLLITLCGSHNFWEQISVFDVVLQPLAISVMMAMMVLGVVLGGGPAVLEAKPVRFISKISYSLYLIHLALWPWCFMMSAGLTLRLGIVSDGGFLTFFMLFYCGFSVFVASLIYFIVERPFLNIKDRLDYAAK